MSMFLVDLESLNEDEREEAFQLMKGFSENAFRVLDKHGKTKAAQVIWTSSEDFESSPIFPKGCPCTRLSY